MKILRRSRVSGSQTPWEQLCGDGFSRDPCGFILVLDREGRLVIADGRWRRRFLAWWTWDEGMRWREVLPERGARAAWREWTRVLRQILESESPLQDAVSLRRGRDTIRFDWLSQPLRDASGQRSGLIVAGKFAREVSSSMDRNEAAGERPPETAAASAAIWIRAKRRRGETGFFVENFSRGAKRVLGGAPQLRIGADLPECLPLTLGADSAALFARRGKITRAVTSLVVERTHNAADIDLTLLPGTGDRHCVLLQRKGARQSARGLMVACGEQLVSLEGELRRAQRLATQGLFAAAIGHELTNCLCVALANAQLFHQQHAGNSADAIKPAIHALEAASRICRQFQNLGGSRNGGEPGVIDLTATAQRSFEMLVRIVPRRVTFEACFEGPLHVRAEPAHIEEIVINLVLNARDATREGPGHIALTVGRTEGAEPGGARCWLEVRDNGTGIAAEDQRRLFTAFFTTKAGRRGTGLGLATVLRLTKAIGGEVKLTSEVGRGTCVRIVLPAVNPVSHVERNHR